MKIRIDPIKLVPLTTAIFKGWAKSLRFEVHGDLQEALDLNKGGQPVIIALWHGELFPLTAFQHSVDECKLAVVISQSKDGEFIARLIERLGHTAVRGSSSRGGVKALLQAKRIIQNDSSYIGCFTVDGPRGPRHKVKDGILFLAQRAGAKILPVRAQITRGKVFDSWDKFTLPAPFSRCVIRIGELMDVTSEKLDADVMKRERERLEQRLMSLGRE